MAISQVYHYPKSPIVNNNWGSDGHNMLVVGMTGVPVAHIQHWRNQRHGDSFFLIYARHWPGTGGFLFLAA